MRKRRVERATLERYAQECLVDTRAQSSRSQVIRDSGRKALADAIAKLPDRPRQCLLLQHYGNGGRAGLSYKKIGEILGITQGAVGRNISDAMKGLRKELQRLKKEDIWEDA
jgi:RNA polymerase sigma factor (sigma-70 family)